MEASATQPSSIAQHGCTLTSPSSIHKAAAFQEAPRAWHNSCPRKPTEQSCPHCPSPQLTFTIFLLLLRCICHSSLQGSCLPPEAIFPRCYKETAMHDLGKKASCVSSCFTKGQARHGWLSVETRRWQRSARLTGATECRESKWHRLWGGRWGGIEVPLQS